MEKYKKYKEAFPNKTDAQCIESLCWEVSDKVETIHKLLEDMADKKYTEENIKKAIELARETERVTLGEEREAWDDIEKYDEMDIIYLLNKQD